MSLGVEPIRLDIRNPGEVEAVCRVAMRHVAARQPINLFVIQGGATMVACRCRPENVATRIISSDFRFAGLYSTPERVEAAITGAVEAALRNLAGEAERPEMATRRRN